MGARSIQFPGRFPDMRLHGVSIGTAEMWYPAALASYVLFVITFFAIGQIMEPAQWGNTCWQKYKVQS